MTRRMRLEQAAMISRAEFFRQIVESRRKVVRAAVLGLAAAGIAVVAENYAQGAGVRVGWPAVVHSS